MPDQTYLQIRGSLSEDLTYRPRPGNETPEPGRQLDGSPAFQLVLLDGNDHVLLEVLPQVSQSRCGSVEDPVRMRVRGTLPLRPEAAAYELRHGPATLHRAAIENPVPPAAETSYVTAENRVTATWARTDHVGATYNVVAVMESGRRFVLARNLTDPVRTVDLAQLPEAGGASLRIEATDGVRSSEVELGPIDVPARPPSTSILVPEPDTQIPFGTPVSVVGCCLDMAGQPLPPEPIRWYFDDAPLSAGSVLTVIDNPGPGTHQLTLAYGEGPDSPRSSVTFDVDAPDDSYRQWLELISTTDQ